MNIFESITEYAKRDYTNFDMSNQWIGSVLDFGSLNCIYGKTVIASDTWKASHSILCKLPPLTAPAFTRIKGIVNTFYCSYASVWKHWNSFISNKPSDTYLSRNQQAAFNGKYVEPCVDMRYIKLISLIACGYADIYMNVTSSGATDSNITITFKIHPTTNDVTWSFDSAGYRQVSVNGSGDTYDVTLHYLVPNTIISPTSPNSIDYSHRFGFHDFAAYIVYLCQSVYRNLINHGVPCDDIMTVSDDELEGQFFNVLPNMAESSIWHNFYRDVQNQSPELCYEEVNGSIYPYVTDSSAGTYPDCPEKTLKMPYGWRIRVTDTPFNMNPNYSGFLNVNSFSIAFSVLTGLLLEAVYIPQENNSQEFESLYIKPSYYNSLLGIKYRNFDKDYFTSASTDPLLGGLSIATPNTIDALRTASKLEEFLERSTSARDFYNFMKYNFGSNPESTRYSKPLLLGTEILKIQIGEQLQTSESTQNSALGTRAGTAEGYTNAGTADHYFNEHGWICSFLSFVVDAQYMQGIDLSDFAHHMQLDYPFPDFANLGAEPILAKEVFYSGNSLLSLDKQSFTIHSNKNGDISQGNVAVNGMPTTLPNTLGSSEIHITNGRINVEPGYLANQLTNNTNSVFGYTPRYSKWKFARDVFAGNMRKNKEYWHTARKFFNTPVIGSLFVSYRDAGWLSNLNRIFAVENDNDDKFDLFIMNNCSVRRCLPLVPNTQLN